MSAQDTLINENELHTHGISIHILGAPTWPIGITYSQMLNDRMLLHLGAGVLSSGFGVEYFITQTRRQRINISTALYGSINYDGFPMVYVPLGLGYTGRKGFHYAINGGLMYCENVSLTENGKAISPWFGFSLGKRFGADVRSTRNAKPSPLRNSISGRLSIVYSLIGIAYERYIFPNLGIEASLGLPGASLGFNLYGPSIKPDKVSFKIGISQGVLYNPFYGMEHISFAGVGIQYLALKGFLFSIDGGPQYFYAEESILPGIVLKLGKAF